MMETKIAAPAHDWQDLVVPQYWAHFTPVDHATWDRLYTRQVRCLHGRIVSPFLSGLKRVGLHVPGIPRVEQLSDRLEAATGWRLASVAGVVPDATFFAMLRDKVFPVGNFIRDGRRLDYLEEPDCFHDIFGHVPLLAYPPMAELMEAIGDLGAAACAAGHAELASRLYWHTVEFGLVREKGETRIWGAGLASSFGEAVHALEADLPRPTFSIEAAAATPYRSDRFQPLYFVSDSLEESADALGAATVAELERLGYGERHERGEELSAG